MTALPHTANVVWTVPIEVQVSVSKDRIAALIAENATLRACLIDATGQRDELRRQLDQSLQERPQ
jgi:hypothetical protein